MQCVVVYIDFTSSTEIVEFSVHLDVFSQKNVHPELVS